MTTINNKLEDSWKSIKPELRQGKNAKTTPRDGSNMALGTSTAVIVTWLIHDVGGIHVPPEVAVAFGAVSGYFLSRKFRY